MISHRNAPKLPYRDNPGSNNPPGRTAAGLPGRQGPLPRPARRRRGRHHPGGRPARREPGQGRATTPSSPRPTCTEAEPDEPTNYARGDAEAGLRLAAVRLDLTYRLARNHHNPMEPHATIARWDGNQADRVGQDAVGDGHARRDSPPCSTCPRTRCGSSTRSSAAASAAGCAAGRTRSSPRWPRGRRSARSSWCSPAGRCTSAPASGPPTSTGCAWAATGAAG